MFKGHPPARWGRQEAVLTAGLALAAALVTFGTVLRMNWLIVAGVAAGAIGGIARVLIARAKTKAEADIEALDRGRQTRVPISRLNEVDPTEVGIDAAPEQSVLPGGEIPRYTAREVDKTLDSAITKAVDGQGPWIV